MFNALKKNAFLLTLIVFVSCFNKKPNYWNDANELHGTWANLERDSSGYLIYEPCDGGFSSSVTISEKQIIYQIGHEDPDTLKIESVKILDSLNEIEVTGQNEYYTIKSLMKIIDIHEKLYLWTWELYPKTGSKELSNGKRMMTREEFRNGFRFIDNPCDTGRVPETKFLPIEYN